MINGESLVHPKIPKNFVRESYFPLSGPGKNFNLEVKIMYFAIGSQV